MLEINKIHLGDSYELIKQVPDKSIDLIITDPPYDIGNTTAGGGSALSRSIQGMNDELAENGLTSGIRESMLEEFMRVMKVPNIYIWCNGAMVYPLLHFFVGKHNCKYDILLWQKSNATPLFNNKYLTDKEYCLYFRKGGYCCPKNYGDAQTIFRQAINVTDKKLYGHPTMKPVSIIQTLVENSSHEGDIILDPFIGSGTTAVACKASGRSYIGVELSEKWHRVACNRLNGEDANGGWQLL